MSRNGVVLLLLFVGCKNQVVDTDPEADADTDTDADADADADTDADTDADADVDCASTLDLNDQVGGATGFDPFLYIYDQGVATSVCATPGTGADGQMHAFLRTPGGGATDTLCAQLFTVTHAAVTSCAACDYAFDPTPVETELVDVLTGSGSTIACPGDLPASPQPWGIDLDGDGGAPALLLDRGLGWETVGPATVSEVGTEVRIDWVWSEEINLD